jgi:hypothetical protein
LFHRGLIIDRGVVEFERQLIVVDERTPGAGGASVAAPARQPQDAVEAAAAAAWRTGLAQSINEEFNCKDISRTDGVSFQRVLVSAVEIDCF